MQDVYGYRRALQRPSLDEEGKRKLGNALQFNIEEVQRLKKKIAKYDREIQKFEGMLFAAEAEKKGE